MKRLRRAILVPVSLAASTLFAQDAGPEDAIFGAIRISSLSDLARSAGAFADRIQPGSGANAAQLPAMAAAFGFAADQEVLAVLLDPRKSAQPYALVLSALDPEQLKANPAFNFKPSGTSPERYQFTLPKSAPMFGAFVGKRLVASPLEAGLDAVLPLVQSDADIRRLRADGGQISLSFSADRIYTAYKPMLDLMLMGMRGQFAKATAANASATANPADMVGAMLGSFADVQDFTLRIAVDADRLDFRSTIQAKPGTTAAALFNAGRGPAVALPAGYDPTSVIFGTVSARPTPEFWTAYTQLTERLLSASGAANASGETAKSLTKVINDFAAIWDGTGSIAVLSAGQGMNGGGSAGITDQKKALALLRTLPELQKNMAAFNAANGLASEVSLGTEEAYGDAQLLDFTQTYRALTPEMQEGLKRLQTVGMDKISATYGITSSRLYYVMGENARADTKRMIDAGAATARSSITPESYGLPAESTAFLAISLPRYLGWISRAGGLPFEVKVADDATKPGFALTADLVDSRADIRVHLATSDIVAVKNAFPKPAAPAPAPVE